MALFGNKKIKEDNKEDKKVDKKTTTAAPTMKDLYAEKEEKKTKTGVKTNAKRRFNGKTLSARVLVKPVITEKAANLATSNKYVFKVNVNSNKIEVAKSVADVYGVDVVAVNIVKMKGKAVSRGRIKGSRSDYKKAIVTLKKEQSIQVHEGV